MSSAFNNSPQGLSRIQTKVREHVKKIAFLVDASAKALQLVGATFLKDGQMSYSSIMILKCELMLLKNQINTNTNKNGFSFPKKCVERLFNYSCFNYFQSLIA